MCFFAIFVYSKFTTLGDSFGYLSADNKDFEYQGVLTSTTLMYTVGHLLKRFLFFDVIASMPFIFLSYYGIKYLLNNFKVAFNKPIFFALIFIPNYLVYTSIISKEAVGSFYSSVIAVMIINYIEGNFKIKLIYLCSIALCFLFKPQFLIFIFEALFLLYATKKIRNNFFVAFLGSSIWAVNIISMYVFSEQINDLAKMMKYNFMMEDARSTRNTSIFDTQNAINRVHEGLQWLNQLLLIVNESSNNAKMRGIKFGIFGTSIAGMWIFGAMKDKVNFFVDEDTTRQGEFIEGRPILAVKDVEDESYVFLALLPEAAFNVQKRINKNKINWVMPPSRNL